MRLHGVMRPPTRPRLMAQAPRPARGDETPARAEVTIDGVTFRLGATVLLRAGRTAPPTTGCSTGRTATIERILIDYDDAVHLGGDVDDDPGRS